MGALRTWIAKNWSYLAIVILVITNILVALGYGRPSLARDPQTRPANAVACNPRGELPGFSCVSPDKKELGSFDGLPKGVTPVMLSVGDEAKLRALPKDGFECLGPISAHFAFYKDSGEIETEFPSTVVYEYTLTDEDIKLLMQCDSRITIENLSDWIVPVYLYLPPADKFVNIWKPFQSFVVTNEAGVITIKASFQFWGDPQNGIGTRPPSG